MLCYCGKCERIAQEEYNENQQVCDYSNSIMKYIPKQFLPGKRDIALNKNLEQQFIKEYIKTSPEFDKYLFDHSDEDLYNRCMENKAKPEHGKAILEEQARTPKYPGCGSTNINKITIGSRAIKTAAFGVIGAVDNAGKTYKCESCGSKF